MKRLLTAVLALACCLTLARSAYADNATEFGIEDDLTVLGTAGSGADPDAEIKGFTVFGSTQVTYPGPIQSGAGNVVVNGYLAVSSGMYTSGPSTFTATVNLPVPGSILVSGAAANGGKVLTSDGATGLLKWGDVSSMVSGDNLGNHVATKTLDMATFDITRAGGISVASATITTLTVTSTSTLTGLVGMGAGLIVTGNVDMNNMLNVDGTSTFVSSVTVTGNLGVSGANKLTVGGNSTFGSSVTVNAGFGVTGPSTFTATVNLPVPGSILVSGAAANGGKVLTSDGATGLLKWGDVSSMVSGDNLGNHTATETLKMANFGIVNVASITANGYIMTNTSMTVTTNLGVGGVTQLGDLPGTDYVGINGAGDATTALKVIGEDVSTKYSAKFYSGANLAAWIRKK